MLSGYLVAHSVIPITGNATAFIRVLSGMRAPFLGAPWRTVSNTLFDAPLGGS